MIDNQRLLERFLRYVHIDTTAREGQSTYPSSPGQLELGRLLRDELVAIGLADALQTDKGIVLATVPSTVDEEVSVIALNAHVDTSPETTGANVRPQVVANYRGRRSGPARQPAGGHSRRRESRAAVSARLHAGDHRRHDPVRRR